MNDKLRSQRSAYSLYPTHIYYCLLKLVMKYAANWLFWTNQLTTTPVRCDAPLAWHSYSLLFVRSLNRKQKSQWWITIWSDQGGYYNNNHIISNNDRIAFPLDFVTTILRMFQFKCSNPFKCRKITNLNISQIVKNWSIFD